MQTIPPPDTTPVPVPPPPAPPTRPRSVLGRLVLSLAVLAVGVLALVDVAGARVPASAYFAVPLTVVAAGLVVGAWYGRARGLIAFGVVLSVLLAISLGTEHNGWNSSRQTVTWQPTGIEQLQSTYQIGAGNAVLNLAGVDFTGQSRSVDVRVSLGNLTVVLPSTVDVQIRSSVSMGNAVVFGQRWSGIGQGEHAITDNGTDGPGGGSLVIKATVDMGNLEVRR